MSAWNPNKFSNASVRHALPHTDRRYVSADAVYTSNDSSNAGQVLRRPGEEVAGFQPNTSRDLLDHLPKDGIDATRGGIDATWNGIDASPYGVGAAYGTEVPYGAEAAVFGGTPLADRVYTDDAYVSSGNAYGLYDASAPESSVRPRQVRRTTTWQTMDKPTPMPANMLMKSDARAGSDEATCEGGVCRVGAEHGAAGGEASDHALRVAANGMAEYGHASGDLWSGMPRRHDLHGAVMHASDTGTYRALVSSSKDAPTLAQMGRSNAGQSVAGSSLARAMASAPTSQQDVDDMWNDGKFGMGVGVDAVFTGVYVDPYTGVEYDVYENEAPPPDGDFRQRDQGMQRKFEALMGGTAPGRPVARRQETVNEEWDNMVPDVPDRDWVEEARARGEEFARQADLMGPHMDDRAWTDGEGYTSMPTIPFNKVGYNDLVRIPEMPAFHLHRGLHAAPFTGGGIDPDAGAHEGAGVAPPEKLSRIKNLPVVPIHMRVGGTHMEAASMAALAELRDPLRAPARIGTFGEQAIGDAHLEAPSMAALAKQRDPLRAPARIGTFGEQVVGGSHMEAASMAALAELRDPLRAPTRIGVMGEQAVGGSHMEAASMAALAELRDPLRAPTRIGVMGEQAVDVGRDAPYSPPDMLTPHLSQRPHLLHALGRAFSYLTVGAEAAQMPPETMPKPLRFAADNPLSVGRAIVDLGLTGPSTAQLADYSQYKMPHRATDMRAMAVGDVGMALITEHAGGDAPYMPPELLELTTQDRDALTLALGRAILHMKDAAELDAGHVGWLRTGVDSDDTFGTAMSETMRAPARVAALGALAMQLADDAGAMYMPPDDWNAPQRGGRDLPHRATLEWAQRVGSRLMNVASEVEAGSMGGLMKFRDPLRADSVIQGVLGRGFDVGVDGAHTIMLADADSVRQRKLEQYTLALGARLFGLGANVEEAGAGTAGLMEWTRDKRARNQCVNTRGIVPIRIVEGHEGLPVYAEEAPRNLRASKYVAPVERRVSNDVGEAFPGAAPTREPTVSERQGHRFGGAPVPVRREAFGMPASAGTFYGDDYTQTVSKYTSE